MDSVHGAAGQTHHHAESNRNLISRPEILQSGMETHSYPTGDAVTPLLAREGHLNGRLHLEQREPLWS